MGMIWNKAAVGGIEQPMVQSLTPKSTSKTGNVATTPAVSSGKQVEKQEVENVTVYSPSGFLKNCGNDELRSRAKTELSKIPPEYRNNPTAISLDSEGKIHITIATGTYGAKAKDEMIARADKNYGGMQSTQYLVSDLRKDLNETTHTFADSFIDFKEGDGQAKELSGGGFASLELANVRVGKNNENLRGGLRLTAPFNKDNDTRKYQGFPGNGDLADNGQRVKLITNNRGEPGPTGRLPAPSGYDGKSIVIRDLYGFDVDNKAKAEKAHVEAFKSLQSKGVIEVGEGNITGAASFEKETANSSAYDKGLGVNRADNFKQKLGLPNKVSSEGHEPHKNKIEAELVNQKLEGEPKTDKKAFVLSYGNWRSGQEGKFTVENATKWLESKGVPKDSEFGKKFLEVVIIGGEEARNVKIPAKVEVKGMSAQERRNDIALKLSNIAKAEKELEAKGLPVPTWVNDMKEHLAKQMPPG